MPMQQVEFEFPDPDSKVKAAAEIEVPGEESDFDLKIDGAVGRENIVKPGKKKTDSDLEIEIVDDTPPKDRGKKPSAPPEDVTDEELENYSDKVKKRIQHFSKGYHDERRAKEQALREREERVRTRNKGRVFGVCGRDSFGVRDCMGISRVSDDTRECMRANATRNMLSSLLRHPHCSLPCPYTHAH